MKEAIAFRVHGREAAALEVRVNFGVFAGRNATQAEIDDLARGLQEIVASFAIIAEEPSAEWISDAAATPSPANAAAPITIASTSEPSACGNGVP